MARLGRAGLKSQNSSKRRWTTFKRIIRYGISNFLRNAWLSLASTVIMTITLSIVLVAVLASQTLTSTIEVLRSDVKMSIYVSNAIDDKSVKEIQTALEDLSSVKSVEYVSSSEAKQNAVKQSDNDPDAIKAFNYAKNMLPGTFNIEIEDINDPSELERFVEENETYKKFFSGDKPSFSSERRTAIDQVAKMSRFVEKFGLVVIGIFLIIALLFVFNTIRMAIFNRKSEIYMMRLIGAEHSFIRGPFIIEAVITGLLAGLVSTALLYIVLSVVNHESLSNYGIVIDGAILMMRQNWPLILIGVALLGSSIAIVSSLLATRKYLSDKTE